MTRLGYRSLPTLWIIQSWSHFARGKTCQERKSWTTLKKSTRAKLSSPFMTNTLTFSSQVLPRNKPFYLQGKQSSVNKRKFETSQTIYDTANWNVTKKRISTSMKTLHNRFQWVSILAGDEEKHTVLSTHCWVALQGNRIASSLGKVLDKFFEAVHAWFASIAVKILHTASIRHKKCHPVLARLCAFGCIGNKTVWKLCMFAWNVVRTEDSNKTVIYSRVAKQNIFDLFGIHVDSKGTRTHLLGHIGRDKMALAITKEDIVPLQVEDEFEARSVSWDGILELELNRQSALLDGLDMGWNDSPLNIIKKSWTFYLHHRMHLETDQWRWRCSHWETGRRWGCTFDCFLPAHQTTVGTSPQHPHQQSPWFEGQVGRACRWLLAGSVPRWKTWSWKGCW